LLTLNFGDHSSLHNSRTSEWVSEWVRVRREGGARRSGREREGDSSFPLSPRSPLVLFK
jgi:hypothetical protein